jgi:hypothetical protein
MQARLYIEGLETIVTVDDMIPVKPVSGRAAFADAWGRQGFISLSEKVISLSPLLRCMPTRLAFCCAYHNMPHYDRPRQRFSGLMGRWRGVQLQRRSGCSQALSRCRYTSAPMSLIMRCSLERGQPLTRGAGRLSRGLMPAIGCPTTVIGKTILH